MDYILALDQSTSATKALLFDTNGRAIDQAAKPHQQHYPQAGWVEHDAEEIYHNTIDVLRTLIKAHPEKQQQILCLSITNQRETFVIFEKETGKPLYHAIVWQCRRGEPLCQTFIDDGLNPLVQNITGLKIDTYFPAAKITWLLEEYPALKTKLEKGEALLGTMDTYLIYRLTGGDIFASDHTNACRTLLYDIHNLSWSAELCELFQVPVFALPMVQESAAEFGSTNVENMLDKAIPIVGVMGDSQAALFAEQCFEVGTGKITFGTGSSVLLNIGNQMEISPNGIVTTIGWVYDGVPTYALEGIINFTGATIAWLKDQLQLIESPAETEVLAGQLADNGGVYLVPAFVGLSAPYWEPTAKATIVGLTPAATKAHLARAALEAIAYRLRDVLDVMQADSEVELTIIHGDGGMVKNTFLMQFVSDMTGLTLRTSSLPELSAFGAVMSGMLGTGLRESLIDLKALPHQFTDYQPKMDEVLRQKNYDGWLAAVKKAFI